MLLQIKHQAPLLPLLNPPHGALFGWPQVDKPSVSQTVWELERQLFLLEVMFRSHLQTLNQSKPTPHMQGTSFRSSDCCRCMYISPISDLAKILGTQVIPTCWTITLWIEVITLVPGSLWYGSNMYPWTAINPQQVVGDLAHCLALHHDS